MTQKFSVRYTNRAYERLAFPSMASRGGRAGWTGAYANRGRRDGHGWRSGWRLRSRARHGFGCCCFLFGKLNGDAEVTNKDGAVLIYEEISRFDVAMNESIDMQITETGR